MQKNTVRCSTKCSATVQFSTHQASPEGRVIPVVNIWLAVPTERLNDEAQPVLDPIECEGELAIAIWNYLIKSNNVTIA